MSFWLRLGLSINDLSCFKTLCDRHGVNYQENEDKGFRFQGREVIATLQDRQTGACWYLCKDGGSCKLFVDNDRGYNQLTQRLGQNGGMLTRDYTWEIRKSQITASGGMVTQETEEADGSVVLKVSMVG